MSVSTSGENLASDAQSCDGGSMCLELALEGERLCKAGDCRAGVAFFQAAIQAGTDDLRTLSAIYSQLGNAYFYLGDYSKAMQYHKHDLTLARTMGDKLGEAKASGNLGNTLKVMGKFTEAIQCCKRQLDLSRELRDKLSEGRALYNLGNVYHAQGKHLGRVGQNDPGHFPQEVRECLLQAVTYYEENLELMRSLGDRAAMGRACGNLGNTCYLLGEFGRAIRYHTERLEIAQAFGDKTAERRANSNLANSHIFLGQFENAAEHYKRTLTLAEASGEAAVAAQACYSLGNTFTLLREHRAAEEYHSRHLAAARALKDRVGEGRAAWSLGNAHAALGNHEKALYYATEHYTISKELGDVLGMATAQMNIGDLRKVLGLPGAAPLPAPAPAPRLHPPGTKLHHLRVRRQSMEQLALIQITPDGKKRNSAEFPSRDALTESEESPVESFLELVSRCQSSRMEEQRAALGDKENRARLPEQSRKDEAFLELITSLQSDRMDSQRADLHPVVKKVAPKAPAPPAPDGPNNADAAQKEAKPPKPAATKEGKDKGDDELLDIIARVQGSRLEDQRTALPRARPSERPHHSASTVPDDDFFALLMRAQASRLEDQRATIPLKENTQNKASKK